MTATTRKGHRCVALPDIDNRRACMYCGRVESEGYTGLSITNLARTSPLGHGRVHDIVVLVPEPVAEMDDDEFVTAGGLGA